MNLTALIYSQNQNDQMKISWTIKDAYALSLPSSGIDFLSFASGNLKLEKLELP